MLYKWRKTYSFKEKKWAEYHKAIRTYPVFKHARTWDFFKTESIIRKYNLHKRDVLSMRTGRGYCVSFVEAVKINKHAGLVWRIKNV